MVEVRRATPEDFAHIMSMVRAFNAKYFRIPLNEGKTHAVLDRVIAEGVIFVSDTGFIAGMVADDLFRDWTLLQEFGWYAEDKSGFVLLDTFIQAGHDLGVNEIRVATLSTSPPVAGRILLSRGFAPLEQSYRLMTGA